MSSAWVSLLSSGAVQTWSTLQQSSINTQIFDIKCVYKLNLKHEIYLPVYLETRALPSGLQDHVDPGEKQMFIQVYFTDLMLFNYCMLYQRNIKMWEIKYGTHWRSHRARGSTIALLINTHAPWKYSHVDIQIYIIWNIYTQSVIIRTKVNK